jgi:hypothetical protein
MEHAGAIFHQCIHLPMALMRLVDENMHHNAASGRLSNQEPYRLHLAGMLRVDGENITTG